MMQLLCNCISLTIWPCVFNIKRLNEEPYQSALKNALIKTHLRPTVGSKKLQISRSLVIRTWTSQSATDGKIHETVSLLKSVIKRNEQKKY